MATFETEVGNPEAVDQYVDPAQTRKAPFVVKAHNTKGSAENRLVKALENLWKLGSRHDHTLQSQCTVAIEQIKNLNLTTLPLNEWRRWEVTDPLYDVTLVVKVRRTS